MKDLQELLQNSLESVHIAPKFQLEPRGERGYIEAKPIRKISV